MSDDVLNGLFLMIGGVFGGVLTFLGVNRAAASTEKKTAADVAIHDLDAAGEEARLKLERDQWYQKVSDELLNDARESLDVYKKEIEDIHKLYEDKDKRRVKEHEVEITRLHSMYKKKIEEIHKEYADLINKKNREIARLKGDRLL